MYRYYAEAAICYVYLSDIMGACPELHDHAYSALEESEKWSQFFMKSRWFTRGWTLQELIAPTSLEFYGWKWNYLGNKRNLVETIYKATGIDLASLRNSSKLSSMSVAQRMSWAAHRQTSRVEDQAYCLLGIFKYDLTP